MKIENINSSSLYNVNSSKNTNEDSSSSVGANNSDSISISTEAKELAKQSREEKLAEVKEKMSTDFYSKKEVLEATANAMLKDIEA